MAWGWRCYAILALLFAVGQIRTLVGPTAEPLFSPHRGVDVGAFYTVALMLREGERHQLGDVDAQAAAQQELQARAQTVNWQWFEPMPHPPAVALAALPLTLMSLRHAYWVWTVAALLAATVAAWCLARVCAPRVAVATALILIGFRPLWGLLWWGEDDVFVLLPVALGTALLLAPPRDGASPSRRRELAAGLLLGCLALRPQFVLIPLLALAIGRRRAALGMAASAGMLAVASVALVGPHGSREYLELWRRYDSTQSWHPGVRPDLMFNVRGAIVRLHRPLRATVQQGLTWSLSLVVWAVAVVTGGRALRDGRAADLALAVIALGMLLGSPHTHQQSMVFLELPLAIGVGRSLTEFGTVRRAGWAAIVLSLHATTNFLADEPTRQATVTLIGFAVFALMVVASLRVGFLVATADVERGRVLPSSRGTVPVTVATLRSDP
jgi:hypothetical protein